jgi:hypothetical protein
VLGAIKVERPMLPGHASPKGMAGGNHGKIDILIFVRLNIFLLALPRQPKA